VKGWGWRRREAGGILLNLGSDPILNIIASEGMGVEEERGWWDIVKFGV